MYIPKQFKVSDVEEIREFAQQHLVAALVTTKKGKPIATHSPLSYWKKN